MVYIEKLSTPVQEEAPPQLTQPKFVLVLRQSSHLCSGLRYIRQDISRCVSKATRSASRFLDAERRWRRIGLPAFIWPCRCPLSGAANEAATALGAERKLALFDHRYLPDTPRTAADPSENPTLAKRQRNRSSTAWAG